MYGVYERERVFGCCNCLLQKKMLIKRKENPLSCRMQFSRRINFYMWGYVRKTNICCKLPVPSSSIFHSFIPKKTSSEKKKMFLCANLMHDYFHIWILSCAVCRVHPQTHAHILSHPPQFFAPNATSLTARLMMSFW